jgi:hypothetical protein
MQSRLPERSTFNRRHTDAPRDQASRMRELIREQELERALHAAPPVRRHHRLVAWLIDHAAEILIGLMVFMLIAGLVSLKKQTMERATTQQATGAEG